MERDEHADALAEARAAISKMGKLFGRSIGRKGITSYPGPKRRDDGFDEARIMAAAVKRQRRQAARILRGHP
jgi:hypothetical protein